MQPLGNSKPFVLVVVIVPFLGTILAIGLLWQQAVNWSDLAILATMYTLTAFGIVEHIGKAMQPTYFRHAWHLLRPGGVFLNHNIALHSNSPVLGRNFIQRYVFPDGDAPPLHTTLRAAEITGFELRDVESLREHYVLTVSHWLRRLDEHADEAKEIAGEITYRLWRLFVSLGVHEFNVGRANLYQTLLVKTEKGKSGLPLRREDWYI